MVHNSSFIILGIIFLLTVEMIVVILAVCLCFLQMTKRHKMVHTVVVREQPRWRSGGGRVGSEHSGMDVCCNDQNHVP